MSEKNSEAKIPDINNGQASKLEKGAGYLGATYNNTTVKQSCEIGLLRQSPFVSHMHIAIGRVTVRVEENLVVHGREGFNTWADTGARVFPENILEDKVINEKIIFSKASKFEKYKNKHLLIVGGGPSTCELDFSKVDSDFIWSTNHFYLNPVVNKLKIDMAMLMGEPDITSKEFLDYRDKFEPMIGFEIHDKWKGFKFDDYNNYFLMHTDFYSKLGACVRMIIFASFLGVKKISFVGLDGPKYIIKGQHAFEKGKTNLPSEYSPAIYKWHYKLFWDYIRENFRNKEKMVEFENLGYGQEYHK